MTRDEMTRDEMTRDAIENTQATRITDALIAEHIFHWHAVDFGSDYMFVPPDGDERLSWATEWDENGFPEYLPHYSTDIGAAWQVVEKLRESGFGFYSEWDTTEGRNLPWAMFQQDDGALDLCSSAKTMPLAICRAALLTTIGDAE